MSGDAGTFADASTSELDSKAVRVVAQVNQNVGIEINAGCSTSVNMSQLLAFLGVVESSREVVDHDRDR